MKKLLIGTCISSLVIFTGSLGFAQSANAADALIQSAHPTIFFDDTNESGTEWALGGTETAYSVFNYDTGLRPFFLSDSTTTTLYLGDTGFSLHDESSNTIALIHENAPMSVLISSEGDISLGENRFIFDRSTASLGIGTVVPAEDLEIQSTAPAIFLDDTSAGSTDWVFGNNVNDMEFFITENGTGGPVGSIMTLDAETGFVGLRNQSPAAPLHIFRNDATQEFLLLQSNQAATVQDRAMMYLVNNGGIRFEFNNPSLGTAWRFQAATGNNDNFEVTKVGTGKVEMKLDSGGNLVITGNYYQNSDRNVKRDIELIDGQEVLTRIDRLPLAEWSYRADPEGVRHVGPMAQDFYAVFGLGSDETKIAPGDMAGVSLVAIKTLSERNANLEERVAQLEALVTQLLPKVAKN